ncbi:hypothetical protein RJ639_007917 [Escallonia herrerae]|uniref:Protein kinase domain-containing protein n=1 Tax=Escallonia herrerae TaxID=1293975 RepID=A0AA88VSF8_9ASTE|nr:hypothetical protein RJ639_007917 [Escallonia herrerae]
MKRSLSPNVAEPNLPQQGCGKENPILPQQGCRNAVPNPAPKPDAAVDPRCCGEVKGQRWPIRQKIALGMACGLAYLHYGSQLIKAGNILLDENFEPKLADFGLAKFGPKGMTHLSTRLRGTLGYVAPDHASYGKLTGGSDVYSYGVLLLELFSGRKALLGMVIGKNGKSCLYHPRK